MEAWVPTLHPRRWLAVWRSECMRYARPGLIERSYQLSVFSQRRLYGNLPSCRMRPE